MTVLDAPGRRSWIPWIFVLGMLVVVAVNGLMITAAIRTFPGLSVDRPYESGIAYNRILALQDAQDRLGWTGTATAAPAAGGTIDIVVTLRDRDGKPLDGLEVQGSLDRPLDRAAARVLEFRPRPGGTYVAGAGTLHPGQWQLTLDGRRPDGRIRLQQRLVTR